MYRKILIFGHSNIGDVVYDLVVINPLKRRFHGAEITFLTSPQGAKIAGRHKNVDRIITYDRHGKHKSFLSRIKFILGLKKEKFAVAVILKKSDTYKFLGISNIWKASKKERLVHQHPADKYLAVLCSHGVDVEGIPLEFLESPEDEAFCESFFTENNIRKEDFVVGVLPLAAWPVKSWPVNKWNRLAELLIERYGVKLINLGKWPDNELGRSLTKQLTDRIIPADGTTLPQAMALLKRCRLFIGPDSSFLHLASCMDIEAIGLYGPTSGRKFYPYFHPRNIIYPGRNFSCMPCYPGEGPSCFHRGASCDFGHCMRAIKVEDVLHRVEAATDLS